MSHILPVASLADQKFSASIPDGWESARDEEWCCYLPAHGIEERQGWKIHISATIEQAHETLEQVAQIAIEHGLPFKHLSTAERFSGVIANYVHVNMLENLLPCIRP